MGNKLNFFLKYLIPISKPSNLRYLKLKLKHL